MNRPNFPVDVESPDRASAYGVNRSCNLGGSGSKAKPYLDHLDFKILVVDDDTLVRESFEELLTLLGCQTTGASGGEQALERLSTLQEVEAVFLDMNMPGLGGPATLRAIRTTHPVLAVVVTTGLADQTVLDLVANDAHTTILTKPISLADLRTTLDRLRSP